MTTWITTEYKFNIHDKQVREICLTHFGAEWTKTFNKTTGRIRDNHGNWRRTPSGQLQFRYPTDFTMFLLVAGNLHDPKNPWERDYIE